MPDLFLTKVLKDRYQLRRQLSKKAGRRTLLAFDQATQQPVILKVLTYSQDLDWEKIRLFQREAELLKTLSHPSIPQYIDVFEFETAASKGYTLVQAYIDAPSLEDHLKAGRCFTENDVRCILESTLGILRYLHSRQPPIIHRDIKPSNILLTDRSGNSPGQVYLVDFGSVQTLANRGGKTMTIVGSYGYMPPEQFGDVACPASDLYSLGVTAIAILTQTHPVDLPKAGLRIQFEDKVSLQPSFQSWLQQMTALEVPDRPNSAQEALRSLTFFPYLISPPKSAYPQLSLTPTQLLVDAVWRSVRAGATLGAISTSIFPGGTLILIVPLLLVIIGPPDRLNWVMPFFIRIVLVGTTCGAILGGINGVLVGILTRLFYFPLTRLNLHRFICVCVSMVVGLVVSLALAVSLWSLRSLFPDDRIISAIPAIVCTGVLMGIPSYKIIGRWYQQTSASLLNRKDELQRLG
ncbi:MAG: serine/threonine-protein kinase [Leptolyngbyaceae cyanobacterium MO_188.B28]|nr:serine/threonine-protein kinase [Leptolyngbyaceae cyanobacterium MO_188.B28]